MISPRAALVVILVCAAIGAGGVYVYRAGARAVAPAPAPGRTPPDAPDGPITHAPPPAHENFDLPALVIDRIADVHAGPSTASALVARLRAGTQVTTYAQVGDWVRVRTADGATGYIRPTSIKVDTPATN